MYFTYHHWAPPLICATMMLFFVHLKGCMGSMSCKIFSFIRSSNVRTSKVSLRIYKLDRAVLCTEWGTGTGHSAIIGIFNENLTQCDQFTRRENIKIFRMLLSKLNTICILMFVVSAQSSLFMNPLRKTFSTGTKTRRSILGSVCPSKVRELRERAKRDLRETWEGSESSRQVWTGRTNGRRLWLLELLTEPKIIETCNLQKEEALWNSGWCLKSKYYSFSHWFHIDLRGNIQPRKQLDSDHPELLCLGSEFPGSACTYSILSGEAFDFKFYLNAECPIVQQGPPATTTTILKELEQQGRSNNADYDYYGSGTEDSEWVSSQTLTDMTWSLRYIADWMDSYNVWHVTLYCILQYSLLIWLLYIKCMHLR